MTVPSATDNNLTVAKAVLVDGNQLLLLNNPSTEIYALLRATIKNALLRQKASPAEGVTPATQIRLPYHSKSSLSVRDYGEGLPVQQLQHISFTLAQVIAAGAALTGFIHVTTYHQKMRTKVRYFQDAGYAFVEIVEQAPTEEQDGLLVEASVKATGLRGVSKIGEWFFEAYSADEIKVHRGTEEIDFSSTSLNSKKFLPLTYGSATVGWVSRRVSNEGMWNAHTSQRFRVLIGRDSYTVPNCEEFANAHPHLMRSRFEVVLNVPMHTVDYPADGEVSMTSERTITSINSIAGSAELLILQTLQQDINNLTEPEEALAQMVEILEGYTGENQTHPELVWRGAKPPIEIVERNGYPECRFTFDEKGYEYRYAPRFAPAVREGYIPSEKPSSITMSSVNNKFYIETRDFYITAESDEELEFARKKIRTGMADFAKAKAITNEYKVRLFKADGEMVQWLNRGTYVSMAEFSAIIRNVRSQRASTARKRQK